MFSRSSGFRLFLGQPWEFPLLKQKHLLLRPGLDHLVQVSASHVSTDTSMDSPGACLIGFNVSIICSRHREVANDHEEAFSRKRGCRFLDEPGNLTFHGEYSRTSCRFECGFKAAVEQFKCVPWYLPQMTSVNPCR